MEDLPAGESDESVVSNGKIVSAYVSSNSCAGRRWLMLEDLEMSVVSVLNEGEGIGLEALSQRVSHV